MPQQVNPVCRLVKIQSMCKFNRMPQNLLHSSSAFFQGASGVDGRGNHYNIIHGDYIVNNGTPTREDFLILKW